MLQSSSLNANSGVSPRSERSPTHPRTVSKLPPIRVCFIKMWVARLSSENAGRESFPGTNCFGPAEPGSVAGQVSGEHSKVDSSEATPKQEQHRFN